MAETEEANPRNADPKVVVEKEAEVVHIDIRGMIDWVIVRIGRRERRRISLMLRKYQRIPLWLK